MIIHYDDKYDGVKAKNICLSISSMYLDASYREAHKAIYRQPNRNILSSTDGTYHMGLWPYCVTTK